MAIEDFSTYTEVDPNSRVTKGTRRVTWASITRDETAYAYKDKGVAHFSGDFTHYLTINTTVVNTDNIILGVHWALANTLDSWWDLKEASGDELSLYIDHGPNLQLVEIDGGSVHVAAGAVAYTPGTILYLKIVRDESVGTYGTLYCYVYSDASRTILLNTLTLTLNSSKKDFQHIYAFQSYGGTSDTGDISGYTEDLELLASLENPSVTTLSMTDYAATTITGNGVINSLGLSSVTAHGHAWNTAVDPVTGDNNVDNGAGSLGVFTSAITGLIDGQTYFVRAYATNSEGTTYGKNVKFTANRSNLELISGEYSVVQTRFHYVDANGKERYLEGTLV